MAINQHIPLADYKALSPEEMIKRVKSFYNSMRKRRTFRHFADKPVPREDAHVPDIEKSLSAKSRHSSKPC